MGKPEDIKRDRWDRPILPHPTSGIEEPYTRASTLSNAIDNTYDLERWKQRRLVVGLSQRADLIAKVQSKPDDKDNLNSVVQTAMEIAGTTAGANLGTAIHTFCELMDKGQSLPKEVEPRIKASVSAYRFQLRDFKLNIVAIEEFVGTQAVMSAGTFDRILETPNGECFIADIKTGFNAPDYAHSTAIQMAVYSRGREYSADKGWGFRLPEDLGVNQHRAILIHLPAIGEPICRLYWVDIDSGWKMARISYRVRQWWKEKPAELMS